MFLLILTRNQSRDAASAIPRWWTQPSRRCSTPEGVVSPTQWLRYRSRDRYRPPHPATCKSPTQLVSGLRILNCMKPTDVDDCSAISPTFAGSSRRSMSQAWWSMGLIGSWSDMDSRTSLSSATGANLLTVCRRDFSQRDHEPYPCSLSTIAAIRLAP